MTNWDSAVQVPSDLLKKADLPLSLESATKNFERLASGVTVQRPTISPTVVAYIKEHEKIVSCLPCKKFSPSQCSIDFGASSSALLSLDKDLIAAEF